jgi:ankyrin repeat protein
VAAILDAGPDQLSLNESLGLVASGCVARQCNVQFPLIELLCEHGADPSSALGVAIAHGEMEAVESLLQKGAILDLATAAALGRVEEFRRLLPKAGSKSRHKALAMAAQFGNVECLNLLLQSGEDPNRYNPKGTHSHSTPLHQAAFNGHLSAVQALIQAGADPTMKDVLFGGTPLGWAEHGGSSEVAAYLRALVTQESP